MAFVTIEDKLSKMEILVFPKLFAEVGAKLEQDAVIKVEGRVTARERDGSPSPEPKVMADAITVVTDEELDNYQKTGQKIAGPKGGGVRRSQYRQAASRVSGAGGSNGGGAGTSTGAGGASGAVNHGRPIDPRKQKLWVLVTDPRAEALAEMKRLCEQNAGLQEVVMVLEDAGEKRPLKMPFKVDACSDLTKALQGLFGENCVKVQ